MPNGDILLVEDSVDDAFLMRRAFKDAGVTAKLVIVENGQKAVDYFLARREIDSKDHSLPRYVLLDLKLPEKTGHEVLAWIKTQDWLVSVIVVILTSSNEPSDVDKAYRLGAHSYLVKPTSADELLTLVKVTHQYWSQYNKVLN